MLSAVFYSWILNIEIGQLLDVAKFNLHGLSSSWPSASSSLYALRNGRGDVLALSCHVVCEL